MRSLVEWMGCYDAVAETLNARWGGGHSKGTVSRKMNGALDWTLPDVIALEDAAGRYPVTRILARRMGGGGVPADGSLISASSSIAKESGEALAAILSAQQSSCADDCAQAIKEVDDAVEALRIARGRLEARMASEGARVVPVRATGSAA